MAPPRTLLQMAGAPLDPSAWEKAALVLIDAQMEYVDGAPVFHVVHHGRPGGLFDPEGPKSTIAPEVAPSAGEAIIPKGLPNAFAKTTLHDAIRASGRTELVVVGFMTHLCVSASVRAALDLGYRTTVVAGATATRDLPDPLGPAGAVQPAESVHRATLAALADRFAVVVRDAQAWS